MDTTTTTTAPPASSVLFARGVIARLAMWATLRIAVQENWGGPDAAAKRTWLASVLVDTFEEQHPTPDEEYIEDMLLQVMSDEFEAVIEDGSTETVAKDLVRLWEETRIGKQDLVLKFEEIADKLKGKKPVVQRTTNENSEEWEDEEEEDGDEDDDMDEDEEEVPQLVEHKEKKSKEPEVDEDGFTLVKRR
ncbi:hypothetical protein CPC08DRAFT_667835 [Agrocybe pediades]|nr:hypothetical protein CPC08DRAFT_667835 [Agrocybe pediades]